jgi:hypothetical protein
MPEILFEQQGEIVMDRVKELVEAAGSLHRSLRARFAATSTSSLHCTTSLPAFACTVVSLLLPLCYRLADARIAGLLRRTLGLRFAG